jgi:hypothetical protein
MILALRVWVEYTKDYVDRLTGGRLPTFAYAWIMAYVILYGVGALTRTLGGGMWFVHIFNGPLLAVAAGVLGRKAPASAAPLTAATVEAPDQTTNQGAQQ